MTRELFFNVGGDPKQDAPYVQPDRPTGHPPIPLIFLEGVTPPNRARADIPAECTGGATVWYAGGRKDFRVILPPVDQQFQAEAGEPPQLPPEYSGDSDRVALHYGPAYAPAGRLEAAGRFLMVNGQRVRWRGISAFELLYRFGVDRDAALGYLDFCAQHRVFPRTFATMDPSGWFHLPPERGRELLPGLLDEAKQRGLYLGVDALIGTRNFQFDYERHISELGQIGAASGNLALSIGNELLPVHDSQDRSLTPDRLLALARLVPAPVPVALGSTHGPEAESRVLAHLATRIPNGFAAAHDYRGNDEDGWKKIRHPNDLGWIADDERVYLINEEPFNADDDPTPGRHLGTAMVCTVRSIGDVFHYRHGVRDLQVPSGAVLDAFLGRVAGWNLVSDDWYGTYRNANQGWPVDGFDGEGRCYSVVNGNEAYTVDLNASAKQVRWSSNTQRTLVASRDDVQVWHVIKE